MNKLGLRCSTDYLRMFTGERLPSIELLRRRSIRMFGESVSSSSFSIQCTPSILRARPKSQIWMVQSSLTSMFPGLRSRWIIFASCRYLQAQRMSYTIDLTYSCSKCLFDLSSFLMSMLHRRSTKYTCLKLIGSSPSSLSEEDWSFGFAPPLVSFFSSSF